MCIRDRLDLIWDTVNVITFAYDTTFDKLTTTVNNNNGNWILEYPNFSDNVRIITFGGDQTATDKALNSLNYMHINTTLREGSPAQLSFDNVLLDGISLGNFPGIHHGTQTWQVSGYDFSAGFKLTGSLILSGISNPSAELNKVELSFGYADFLAPITSNVYTNPNPAAADDDIDLTATIDDSTTGNFNIYSAEFRQGSGSWNPMVAQDASFDSPTEEVAATFTAPTSGGDHTICVRGTDSAGNTSQQACITLTVDDHGPSTSYVSANPNPANTGVGITLTAVVDDTSTGGGVIDTAQYKVGSGTWLLMVATDGAYDEATENVEILFNPPDTTGQFNLCVRATDSLGNTGGQECTTLSVDNLGPLASAVVAAPNPVPPDAKVNLSATVDDSTTGGSIIQSAEYQLDGGLWTPMSPQDGVFDLPSEAVANEFIAQVGEGLFDLCVRGTDNLGNTGASTCAKLTVVSSPSWSPYTYLPLIIFGNSNP